MKNLLIFTLISAILGLVAYSADSSSRISALSGTSFYDAVDNQTGQLTGGFETDNIYIDTSYRTDSLDFSFDHCRKLQDNGRPENKLDIVFVPVHQYGNDGLKTRFVADVDNFINEFHDFGQLNENMNKINFYRIDALYAGDGCMNYYGNPVCNRDRIVSIASQCQGFDLENNDQIVILFDDDTIPVSYSRADFDYNMTFMRTNASYLMVHEFGHSFAGLGDEYDTGYPASVDPWFPNCASDTPSYTCLDKWGDEIGENGVACFLGCGASNWYRPTDSDSVMKNVFLDHFGPVSKEVVDDLFSIYSNKIPVPVNIDYQSYIFFKLVK